MNNEQSASEEFEALLRSEAPLLKKMRNHPQTLSPRQLASVKKRLEDVHPFFRALTNLQMRQVILELFKARPMDGSALASLLRKCNVKLLGSTGEGELYGVMTEMENAKLIAGEWKEGEVRRKRVYGLTDLGRAEIQPVATEEAELAQWLLTRVSS